MESDIMTPPQGGRDDEKMSESRPSRGGNTASALRSAVRVTLSVCLTLRVGTLD